MNIRKPRTRKFDYVLQFIDTNGIRSKTISLRAAQPNWLDKGIDFRAKTLHHWKELLEDYYADLLEALIDDTGRKAESEQAISYVFRAIDHWSIIAQHFLREPEVIEQDTGNVIFLAFSNVDNTVSELFIQTSSIYDYIIGKARISNESAKMSFRKFES